MEEKITEILKKATKALSAMEINDLLGYTTTLELAQLNEKLRLLSDSYIIYHSNKDKYMLFENSHLKKGLLHVNKKGNGFVTIDVDNPDIFIEVKNLNGALNNDLVVVEIIKDNEGRILKVIKRSKDTLVGMVTIKRNKVYVIPDDKKMKIVVLLKNVNGLVEGHKVLVKLDKRLDAKTFGGSLVKLIGHVNDPGIDILSIVYNYNINIDFNEDISEELKNIPDQVLEKDLVGRRDLRNKTIFTIDGDDTKDIDDAISIVKLANGNYQLGVHIADVAYYVKEDSALDKEALDRGTSVYLVDRVIPMLPHQLSNGICSLNPGVDRLTMSCEMIIDTKGNVVSYEIYPSVIRSAIQMTYKCVNKILEDNIVPDGYEQFVSDLKLMKELADILRDFKKSRGSLDFDTDEAKILVDETGIPYEVTLRDRGVGENLIEDFMIAANECVATHITMMELPFIYRVHEYPKEENIREFLTFLSSLGYNYTGNMKNINPKIIQGLLEFVKDQKEARILTDLLLRKMRKAEYRKENLGHFGLASKCYTHFTSPIRRYPDTTVHRLLRTYLVNHDLDINMINHWDEKLIYISEHSSKKELDSVECEREVESMKMAEYMEKHIGEVYQGMISGVTNFGLFVQLDNMIEGLVPITDMKDFFHFNEATLSLIGERTKQKYTIGDMVCVKVVRASKEDRQIDFEIVKGNDENEKTEKKVKKES